VDERDPRAIDGNERPHDIQDRSADATGAVFRRGEDDDLGLAATDRIRDPCLMQPRVGRLARIDLRQVAHVAGDEIVAARRRRSRSGLCDRGNALTLRRAASTVPSRCRTTISTPQGPDAPASAAPRRCRARRSPRRARAACRPVDMDAAALLDQLERMVDGRRHRDQLRLRLADVEERTATSAAGRKAPCRSSPKANRLPPTTSSDVVIIGCSVPAAVGDSSPAVAHGA